MSNYLLNDFEEKENKIKEKLYILFYELTSEIKEAKIEIDEEDYLAKFANIVKKRRN